MKLLIYFSKISYFNFSSLKSYKYNLGSRTVYFFLYSTCFHIQPNRQPTFLAFSAKDIEVMPQILPSFGAPARKRKIGK